eukprot:797909-Prorocentrum_lima.AAC.1
MLARQILRLPPSSLLWPSSAKLAKALTALTNPAPRPPQTENESAIMHTPARTSLRSPWRPP